MNPNVGGDGTCFSAGTNCTWQNYLANWSVQEGTSDVYGMASFDFPNFYWPISGNVGLRYVSTHTGSTGYSQNTNPTTKVVTFQKTTITGQYQQALPSANLKVDILPDELIARFAAGEVMARPAPSQLALNRTLDIVGHTGRSGNPGLLPFLSTDYDAGLEWYFNKFSFVSLGYFNKEISRFIQTTTSNLPVDDGTGALVNYSIQSFSNNNVPVTINGIEVNVQYAFDWLPEPFDGFGILANYTSQSDTGFNAKSLIDGSALSFPGLSRTAYNYTLFYEKYGFSLRASYVWRSRWLINAAGRGNLPEFNDSYGEVDLSANYEITPEVSVFTDVVNLTDAQLEQENAPARPISFDTFGQRIYFGVRAKF
jgi:TonB-dependent receptor